ncbi:MAG: UDP-N-acetylmuramate--L-alanine ligase, partial [Chitinophagaceae bacterium]|nr:UDP-N-acetylmuramate--L-alanine ligase [Chitinophagaceae bacterium]
GKTCTVIFQPHLFTRTRDHADGFAEVLDLADRVVLLPIYPARELPIEGVNSEMILERMKNPNKELVKKEDLMSWAQQYAKTWNKELGNVLVTAGAGDIDGELVGIKEILNKS